MVRAGGQHYCVEASEYVPMPLGDVGHALRLRAGEGGLSALSCDAAAAVERVVTQVDDSLAAGDFYFYHLEKVFVEEMNSPKNSHLLNFFIIVPALTLNFVEHMLAAKVRQSLHAL
mmetsp:Transcript_54268/g.125005  ORF Transcript_54268/g.125005 Transcript_54268/m.125005 type:complete len:116 (+) Transcript_54268:119-466(+)